MERSGAALWTCLLGAGLALVVSITTPEAVPRPPRLIGCVFLNRANVTCRWDAGGDAATSFTLDVQKKSRDRFLEAFTCKTTRTSCTAGINNSDVRFNYCVVVTAYAGKRNLSSAPRCQSGRTEVMLPPVVLDGVNPVWGRPLCLNLSWSRTLSKFPVSSREVKDGNLNSQIELTAQGQLDAQVRNVTVKSFNFLVCSFRPDTSYSIRLRHRYRGPASPWSPWSNAQQRRTGEDAPSAAPAFWRRVELRNVNRWRRVSLLWKPLPHFLANGRVLFYNVSCRTESAELLRDHGSCRDLLTNTSCSLLLPSERCSCALTASNSAGTSPEARLWLLGSSDAEPPPTSPITADPLDGSSLEVRWAAPEDPSLSGFVLEWVAVREDASSAACWEILNSSCTEFVITEGIKPMELYSVSLNALFGERGAGKNRSLQLYSVQGAPSAGPVVKVQQISGSTVELSWSPVPVELLRGFIRNYTLCYSTSHQAAQSVLVPAHVHAYSLKRLSPGTYDIFMRANTDAGAGAAGPVINVHIDSEEMTVVMFVSFPLMMTALLLLLLLICLSQNSRVTQKLWRDVLDPSHSSVAHWTPKTSLEGMKHSLVPEEPETKYSEVYVLGEREQQSCDWDQQISCHSHLQTYSTHPSSPGPVRMCQTPQMFTWSPAGATTTSSVDLSCSYITFKALTSPYVAPFYRHAASISDVGEEEPPDSALSSPDTPETLSLQHRTPASFSELCCSSADWASLNVPDTFSRCDAASDLVLVEMSYCPVACEAYGSLAV